MWIYRRSGDQTLRKEKKQIWYWEKLGLKAVSTKASADPMWSSEVGWPFTVVSCCREGSGLYVLPMTSH